MNFLSIFLQTTQSNPWGGILPLVAIIAIFYFFMIRPQQKKQKEINAFRSALKKGDKVLTVGGIYGTIDEVKETTVLVSVDNNVKMEFEKSAIVATPAPAARK